MLDVAPRRAGLRAVGAVDGRRERPVAVARRSRPSCVTRAHQVDVLAAPCTVETARSPDRLARCASISWLPAGAIAVVVARPRTLPCPSSRSTTRCAWPASASSLEPLLDRGAVLVADRRRELAGRRRSSRAASPPRSLDSRNRPCAARCACAEPRVAPCPARSPRRAGSSTSATAIIGTITITMKKSRRRLRKLMRLRTARPA